MLHTFYIRDLEGEGAFLEHFNSDFEKGFAINFYSGGYYPLLIFKLSFGNRFVNRDFPPCLRCLVVNVVHVVVPGAEVLFGVAHGHSHVSLILGVSVTRSV